MEKGKKNYDKDVRQRNSAINSLARKGVEVSGNKIDISKAKNLGIKSWGIISYFQNYEHFFLSGKYKDSRSESFRD